MDEKNLQNQDSRGNGEAVVNQKPVGSNFNELELEVLEFWRHDKTFQKSLEQTSANTPYVFYDGPPFATGLPHYGHILGSTIKDAFGRYHTMKGEYVRRVWGWDCHGLPIENIVEKKLNISGKKQIEEVGVEKFNAECRDSVLTYVNDWASIVERIGRWVDFDNSYKTMDTKYMESVWWALSQIWQKGLIYQDHKVLMYCSRCETPLSNFEVAMDNSYKDVTETSVYVKFKLESGQRIVDNLTGHNTYAVAWTTTPWTLPGNTALNIGPDITYVLVEQNGEQLVLAKDRLQILQGEYEVKSEFSARSLEGLKYEPLFENIIANPDATAFKIYTEDYVTTTDGSGVVHNAAMYGEVDFEAAKARNLPRQNILDQKGEYNNLAPEFLRGMFFKNAEKHVLEFLKTKNLVYKLEDYTHSYPHCWRCSTPLYYAALPAWLINIQKIKSQLLELNENINWYPSHLKYGRFAKSVEVAPDWNISRNRFWATPLPFWICKNENCANKVCVSSLEELKTKSINFAEVYPNYNPNDVNATDLHKPFIDRVLLKCENCSGQMNRVPEVVDCWVESGCMPFAELHHPFENSAEFEARMPADFVSEYIPQTRAWFYVMHVISAILFGKAPFKNVVTSGTVLADDGSKMSKSKNNFPDPQLVIEKYGTDSMRYYLLTSPVTLGEDLSFSEKNLAEVNRKLSMILLNMTSFLKMFAPQPKIYDRPIDSNLALAKWGVALTDQFISQVTKHYDNYEIARAGREIQDFITELSTWFVRRSRDQIKLGGAEAEELLNVLGFALISACKTLAPVMPFLSEHVYKAISAQNSVHLTKWPEPTQGLQNLNEQILQSMVLARSVVELGLRLRKNNNLKVRQPLAELIYVLPESNAGKISDDLNLIIASELNIKKVAEASEILPRNLWINDSENGVQISINLEVTEELKLEGLARDLERLVQDLRKKSGLSVGDKVNLYFTTQNDLVNKAFSQFFDKSKTGVLEVSTSLEVEADFESQTLAEGEPLWIGLEQV